MHGSQMAIARLSLANLISSVCAGRTPTPQDIPTLVQAARSGIPAHMPGTPGTAVVIDCGGDNYPDWLVASITSGLTLAGNIPALGISVTDNGDFRTSETNNTVWLYQNMPLNAFQGFSSQFVPTPAVGSSLTVGSGSGNRSDDTTFGGGSYSGAGGGDVSGR